MSNYQQKILNQFKRLGFNQNSYLELNQLNRALDTLSSMNCQLSTFDRGISQQLYQHSNPNNVRGVKLSDFVDSVCQAEKILRQSANQMKDQIANVGQKTNRQQIRNQFAQVVNDHRIISRTFNLDQLNVNIQQSKFLPSFVNNIGNNFANVLNLNQNNSNYASENIVNNANNSGFGQEASGFNDGNYNTSKIFSYQTSQSLNANDLKLVLFVAVAAFFVQLILAFQKHHFMSIMVYFAILSIFFLNYFDKNYIKFVIIFIVLSVVFDIVWLGVNASQYWNVQNQTQHGKFNSGFLKFVYFCVIALIAVKLAIGAILFKYRNNEINTRKNVSAIGYKIKLDGNPAFNPLNNLLRQVPTFQKN